MFKLGSMFKLGALAPRLARLAIGFRAARKPDDFVQADLSACDAQADAPE
jgi:hypothetical protein